MALSNVNLTDTFDIWRTRTNQLIVSVEQSSTLANAAYARANSSNDSIASAFAKANTANYFAYLVNANTTAAFDKANTGGSISFLAFDRANAEPLAQTVYSYANTINAISVAAFARANNAEGGGYFKGNNGPRGNNNYGRSDIFRVNVNYINQNIYFDAGENASATGPLSVNVGNILQINTDARVVII
jgi:hypothetical protein